MLRIHVACSAEYKNYQYKTVLKWTKLDLKISKNKKKKIEAYLKSLKILLKPLANTTRGNTRNTNQTRSEVIKITLTDR